LDAWQRAPIEFESRACRAEHDWSAVDAAEDVELVVMQVDRDGIVGLVGRTLRAEPWGRAKKKRERGKSEALAGVRQRRFFSGTVRVRRQGSHLGKRYIEYR
jgi:hypothetical protein